MLHQKYGSGAPKIWIRCAQNMDQVRQNSLKKLEGAGVSMQLRGLQEDKHAVNIMRAI
jgi:hypothetical protein